MIRLRYLILFGAVCTIIHAQTVDEISARYNGSDNTIIRKQALHDLGKPQNNLSVQSSSVNDSMKVLSLLRKAFNDPNPSIVEEAVSKAAELKFISTDQDLNQLYRNSEKRFGGYHEKIECAVLTAAGRIGGAVSRSILIDALSNDNGCYKSKIILGSIRVMGDTAFVQPLVKYVNKLDKYIEEKKQLGEDPIQYSDVLSSLSMAQSIVSNLSLGKEIR